MNKIINKLNNHRQLKIGEIICKGDFYNRRGINDTYHPVKYSIGNTVNLTDYFLYSFWRRRHTKKLSSLTNVIRHLNKLATPSKAKVEKKNVAIVNFGYPSRDGYIHGRLVQVIGMDDDYLWGLEITKQPDGTKYQFKKFRQDKMTTSIILKSYGPAE